MIYWVFNLGYAESTRVTDLALSRDDELDGEAVVRKFVAAIADISLALRPALKNCCQVAIDLSYNFCNNCGTPLTVPPETDPLDILYDIWKSDYDTWIGEYQEVFEAHGFYIDVPVEAVKAGNIMNLASMIRDYDAEELKSPDFKVLTGYIFLNRN